MKRVLVVYYTQTGQQKQILDRLLSPLEADADVELTYHRITPVSDYPFPWDGYTFFDAFPESFLQLPCELEPVDEAILQQDYDLIALGYQVWYPSPSIAFNAFRKSKAAREQPRGKPVITVLNCRNSPEMAPD